MMREHDVLAYVLGELDATATTEFERAMSLDPLLRDEVERVRPIAHGLDRLPAEAWDPPAPPPLTLPPEPRRHRTRFRLVAAACAVGLVLIGVAIGTLLDGDGDPGAPAENRIALEPVGGGDARGSVEVSGGDGDPVTLRVNGLDPADAGRFYELWLLGSDGELIALGSFTVGADGAARVSLPLPVDPSRFQYFDLSLEPADGDPGHSGDSILRGPTTS